MRRPYVHINVAMTADGKIDTIERKGATISSAFDKERMDRLRAGSDAVLVGGRTLLVEDPKLTVKSTSLQAERVQHGLAVNPAKVGVVTSAEFKSDSEFLNAGPAKIFVFTTSETRNAQIEKLRASGVDVILHSGPRVDLESMLARLSREGIQRLLVEGGGTLNFELIRLRLVDEITIYLAPMVFGGSAAPTLADGAGLSGAAVIPLVLDHVENPGDGGLVLHYHLKS